MADAREPVIGIDLGTTNSVVATVQGAQPVVIRSRSGQLLTPSVVALTRAGKRLVGQIAKRQAITNPEETVYAAKRLIGRKYSSPQVQEALKILPYRVVCGEHDDIRIRMGERDVALPEIGAMVLQELKLDAEAHFGRTVTQAVITVPAYFNDGQRQATKDAGRIAGLEVLRIINEPTAAALAFGFNRNVEGKLAVFDFGGGTFDISVLQVSNNVFDVLATGGDSYLGGEDYDNRIIDWLVFSFAKEHGVDLRKERMALQRLKDAAEKAKIELSTVKEANLTLPFIYSPPGGGSAIHLQRPLSRAKFEELTADLTERTLTLSAQVLKEAGVKPGELKEVILVGGMSRVPRVAERVKQFFGREPCKGVHPDEVVALGAAVQANALTSEQSQVLLLDVTPQSLGVAIAGGYVRTLIPKNSTVPTATTERFNTSKDGQTTVKIMVLQGESELAHQNELLGEFQLSGLRQALRGELEIEVTFDISSEGIVSVSARDTETGQRQSITVTASGGLTEAELRDIVQSQADQLLAASASEEHRVAKDELLRLVQDLEQIIPRVEKVTTGTDFGSDALVRAQAAVKRAKAEAQGADPAAIKSSIEELGKTLSLFRGVVLQLGSR